MYFPAFSLCAKDHPAASGPMDLIYHTASPSRALSGVGWAGHNKMGVIFLPLFKGLSAINTRPDIFRLFFNNKPAFHNLCMNQFSLQCTNQSNKFQYFHAELPYKGIYQNLRNTTFMHTSVEVISINCMPRGWALFCLILPNVLF